MKDIIVEEIRLSRTEHAKKFDFDIHDICEDVRKMQQSCGHSVISLKPKPFLKATGS